jgi:hypothetical protein
MIYRKMVADNYEAAYQLWEHTEAVYRCNYAVFSGYLVILRTK